MASYLIIATGIEAGGHGSSSSPPLLTLIPSIISISPPDGPPILAAGGLSHGAHIASLLALGADGVVIGTRFLLSPESLYTDPQRQALVAAGLTSSVRTMAFDHARNTLGWPQGIDGRGLRNRQHLPWFRVIAAIDFKLVTVDDFERGEDPLLLRQRFEEGVREGDPKRMLVWAGTGVGLMNSIMPAKVSFWRRIADRLTIPWQEIVHELHFGCLQRIQAISVIPA